MIQLYAVYKTHFVSKDTNWLIVNKWKKRFYVNSNQKRTGVIILTTDKIKFQSRKCMRQRRILYLNKRLNTARKAVLRARKIIDTWSRRIIAKDSGKQKMENNGLAGTVFQLYKIKMYGDGWWWWPHNIMKVFDTVPLNLHLKIVKVVNFMLCALEIGKKYF